MNEPSSLLVPSGSQENEFARLVAEITSKLQAGEPVDVDAYAHQAPLHEQRLRRLIPAVQALVDLGLSTSDTVQSSADENAEPTFGTLGDFRILREVGRGGMGVVYEAEQMSLGRRVALKVLPLAAVLDPKQLRRFKNEAQAAAILHHTNIVPVHGVGCQRGVHYYAMQYIAGQTLAEVIADLRQLERRDAIDSEDHGADGPRLARCLTSSQSSGQQDAASPERGVSEDIPRDQANHVLVQDVSESADTDRQVQAAISTQRTSKTAVYCRSIAGLGIQAAQALEHAHEEGVVHRDIKPSNLILDERGKVWVTDFGLALIETDPGLTLTGDILGTIRYMSPEQALAKRVVIDHRTDIYSLGVTLYELLTLEPAFDARDRQELLRQVAFEEPRPPRRMNKSVPQELETIVLKSMAKNPAERYDTAQELADDLQRFLDDKPIRARRPTLLQRAAKWSRRHRPVVWTAAVILVMTTLGLSLSTYFIAVERNKTKTALDRAESNLDLAHQNLQRALDAADQPPRRPKRPIGRL